MAETKTIQKRNEIPFLETWATEDIFSSDAKWEEAFTETKTALSDYERFKGHLGESAEMLYGCLKMCIRDRPGTDFFEAGEKGSGLLWRRRYLRPFVRGICR